MSHSPRVRGNSWDYGPLTVSLLVLNNLSSLSLSSTVIPSCPPSPTAAIVSSEQNPVIIIAVVAVAGTIILVFMVFGFIIGRRYALAGPVDSPLL